MERIVDTIGSVGSFFSALTSTSSHTKDDVEQSPRRANISHSTPRSERTPIPSTDRTAHHANSMNRNAILDFSENNIEESLSAFNSNPRPYASAPPTLSVERRHMPKPMSSGFRPRNSLYESGLSTTKRTATYGRSPKSTRPRYAPLHTESRAGENVPGHKILSPHFADGEERERQPKRRRLEASTRTGSMESSSGRRYSQAQSPPSESWFDRDIEHSTRRMSANGSHSNAALIIGAQPESRNTDRLLWTTHRKPRKPKSFSGSQVSVIDLDDSQTSLYEVTRPSPAEEGSRMEPVNLDEDDNIEIVNERPVARRNSSTPMKRQDGFKSSAKHGTPSRNIAVQGDCKRQLEKAADMPRNVQASIISGTTPSPVRGHRDAHRTTVRHSSPALTTVFSRVLSEHKTSGPTPVRSSQSRRQAMLPSSAQPERSHVTDDDDSADELALDTTAAKVGSKLRAADSPKNNKRRDTILPLQSFCTLTAMSPADAVLLRYKPDKETLTFESTEGRTLPHSQDAEPLDLSNIHISKVSYSKGDSRQLLIDCSRDKKTGGKIILEFKQWEHLHEFLELSALISPESVRRRKLLTDEGMSKSCQNAKEELKQRLRLQQKHRREEEDPEALPHKNNAHEFHSPHVAAQCAPHDTDQVLDPGATKATSGKPTFNKPAWAANLKQKMQSDFACDTQTTDDLTVAPERDTSLHEALQTRSSRRLRNREPEYASPEPEYNKWTKTNGIPRWDAPLVYPPEGAKRTTVEAADIERLDEGEMLNDNIIHFCLRQLEEEHPELKGKVHMFNSFFYTALSTSKTGRKGFNYDAVKRWTKSVDLFRCPYVLVPINVDLHWFVTIICNLDKVERDFAADEDYQASDDDLIDNQIPLAGDQALETSSDLLPMDRVPRTQKINQSMQDMSLSDGGSTQHQSDDETVLANVTAIEHESPLVASKETNKFGKLRATGKKDRKKPAPSKIDYNQPYIITLDSLGAPHPQETRFLRDYIVAEAAEKRSMSINREDIKGIVARGIPAQTNFYDCGAYLVGYVAEFLKDPSIFVRKTLSRELDRNNDFVNFDVGQKRESIRNELLRLQQEQTAARKATKREARRKKLAAAEAQVGGSGDETNTRQEATRGRAATPGSGGSPERKGKSSALAKAPPENSAEPVHTDGNGPRSTPPGQEQEVTEIPETRETEGHTGRISTDQFELELPAHADESVEYE